MNAKEHLNFGLYSLTMVVLGSTIDLNTIITEQQMSFIGCLFIGALLPDIDHQNGTLCKLIPLYMLHNIFKKMNIWIFKHGGITHTILANSIMFYFAWKLESYSLYGLGIGYTTHLYIDHVTGNKLGMLWFPVKELICIYKKMKRWFRVKNRNK